MMNIQTADISIIFYIIIGVIGLVVRLLNERSKKAGNGGGKLSDIDLEALLGGKKSQPQHIEEEIYTEEDRLERKITSSLNRQNDDIYNTVSELQELKKKQEQKEFLANNIQINKKGRYNAYSVRGNKQASRIKRMISNKRTAKEAIILAEIIQPKFKS